MENDKKIGIKKSSFNRRTRNNKIDKDILDLWQVNSTDTNSADIEIGIYTKKIRDIEVEIRKISYEDPQFKILRNMLLKSIGERRKLLHYLEISDHKRYRKAMKLIYPNGLNRELFFYRFQSYFLKDLGFPFQTF